jgi:ketosteroid isomerase-like protein
MIGDGSMDNVAIVAEAFRCYHEQDLAAALGLYAEDFRFTSPQDDHIDKSDYFERCFPTTDRVARQELLHLVPAGESTVFAQYEYDLRAGGTYRNMEAITMRDGLIHEVQVYFGGAVG